MPFPDWFGTTSSTEQTMTIPVIAGPTAAGKTAAAIAVFGGTAAISADSMQVYRCMDIATAKPDAAERAALPHYLIDCVEPEESWSVGDFSRAATELLTGFERDGIRPVVVGGTGLYLKALLFGLFDAPGRDEALRAALEGEERNNPGCLHARLGAVDPETAARLQPNDIRRIVRALEVFTLTGRGISDLQRTATAASPWRFRVVGLTLDREELGKRIEERIDRMFARGLLDEVRRLVERGCRRELPSMQGLGYHECLEYLAGETSLDEARARFVAHTRDLARRQIMLFRRLPGLVWFHADDHEGIRRHFARGEG